MRSMSSRARGATLAVVLSPFMALGACDYPVAAPESGEAPDDSVAADIVADTLTPDVAVDSASPDTRATDSSAPDSAAVDSAGPADTTPADTTPAETAVAQDSSVPDTTVVEPDIEEEDPSMPGPLPDMGLPPLGYLGSPPFGVTSTTCGTSSWWWGYTLGSENMQPGAACIDCHTQKGPEFSFAGTVMADYNEADECRGIPGVTVDIIDAEGRVALTMVSNGAGNFFSESTAPVAMPYTARITLNGRMREMDTPADHGDCNVCHSSVGAEDAPGRIVLP